MKNRLSFASFNLVNDNILEVIIDEGINLTLEMVEECYSFVNQHIRHDFGLLIHKINNYDYTFEAKLSMASFEHMKAIAFVYYCDKGKKVSQELQDLRAMDGWNQKNFSGLELGWQKAQQWLAKELNPLLMSEKLAS